MRILNGKVFIDDVSLVRTDGHSVTMRDLTGTSLVIPLNVLNDVMEKVLDAKEKSLQVKETTE
jgi:predicted RNA-binding protein